MDQAKRKDPINENGIIKNGVEVLLNFKSKRVKLIIEAVKYEGFYCYGYLYTSYDKHEGSGKGPHVRDLKYKLNKQSLINHVFKKLSTRFSDQEFKEMRSIVNRSRAEQLSLF